MNLPIILAHGALGWWDEIIFFSISVIFLVMMGRSWLKSRDMEPDLSDENESGVADPSATPTHAESEQPSDRFRLD